MSASTVIPDRLTFGIVISGAKRYRLRGFSAQSKLSYLACVGVPWAVGSAMADVFVSYAKTDRSLASKLVAMLEAEGWSV
jgi:hypothetical protein